MNLIHTCVVVFVDMYWTNPQYHVTLHDPDEDGDGDTCTLIVSLIQKDQCKAKGAATFQDVNKIIGYDIFKVSLMGHW